MLILSLSGINKYISTLDGGDKKFLTSYQQLIVDYFKSPSFSDKILLLLYMEVGTGKTLTSLACGIEGLKLKLFKRIVVLSPKSVQDEFEKNLTLYYKLSGKPRMTELDDKIIMIPYNANNSSLQFSHLGDLDQTLFIIDEAHLFMKSIIKCQLLPKEKRKDNVGNAKKIYDTINTLKNKKVICLTGTPSSKHPFETVPMFNLAGCNFPPTFESFCSEYVDNDNNKMINKNRIINKISGMVAYVKSDSSAQNLKASPLNIIEVEMSANQYIQYLIDYRKELNEKGFTNKKNMFGIQFGAKSSFHAKTFEDCIYWNEALTNREDDKDRYVGQIKIDQFHCPKILRMYNDTIKVKGPCVFYFRFVKMYGTETMERKLIEEGYELVKSDPFIEKKKRYVLFTGDIPYSTRIKWKRYFNDKRNMYGEYIKYLILSPSGSVGVSLMNVRYLGIGSVEFNYSALSQILGRCNRLNSHINLPPKDRVLNNYIYISTKNMAYYNRHKDEIDKICYREAPGHTEEAPTIERIIYQDSLKDDEINKSFRQCLIESSIIKLNERNKFVRSMLMREGDIEDDILNDIENEDDILNETGDDILNEIENEGETNLNLNASNYQIT